MRNNLTPKLSILAMVGWMVAWSGCSSREISFPPAADLQLEDYRGKVVLLNFWATWCGPCRYEIPDLVRLYKSVDQSRVAVISVSLDREGTPEQIEDRLKGFVETYKINYPVFLDSDGRLHQAFGSFPYVPATFLIDQNGQVEKSYAGARSFETFSQDIKALLDRS